MYQGERSPICRFEHPTSGVEHGRVESKEICSGIEDSGQIGGEGRTT